MKGVQQRKGAKEIKEKAKFLMKKYNNDHDYDDDDDRSRNTA